MARKEQAAWTNEWAGTDEEALREEQVWREGWGRNRRSWEGGHSGVGGQWGTDTQGMVKGREGKGRGE